MSGFAGIIHLDDKPVEDMLVKRLTRLAERHGGDTFSVHCNMHFGFGHSLLRATTESANETQPFSLDGNTWITGDVRIDGRDELVEGIKSKGGNCHSGQPDIELVLHAYNTWGDECQNHLLGDFAFAIWNRQEKSLFCARDSFGVKPFYYARLGHLFVFSNDIGSILSHPAVSDERNENAVSDYLAFGYNLDEQTTYFAHIQRLPPSHVLTLNADCQPRMTRYSRLVFDHRIEYENNDEYIEHFLVLFKQAVQDRLRTDSPAFELSGGLDSTSVASLASVLNRDNPDFSGKAITTDTSKVNPLCEEAEYARAVAVNTGLIHETIDAGLESDFYTYLDTSQPYAWPFAATTLRFAEKVRQHGCVMLSGQGADPFIQGSGDYLLDLFRNGSLSEFLRTLTGDVIKRKSILGHGLRVFFQRDKPRIVLQDLPQWLEQDAFRKNGSVDRWKDLFYTPGRYPRGCRCEIAYDELRMPFWSHLFESYYHDLLSGIDCRHPFFDIRLINYLFAIPPLLKQDKNLMRQAMTGLLPDSVLNRKKAVVQGDIVQKQLSSAEHRALLSLEPGSCARWVDEKIYRENLRSYANGKKQDRFNIVNPLSLQLWTDKRLVL